MCPDVALVHDFVSDIVKHEEMTVIVRQNEIIIRKTRGCNPLIVNLIQVSDFSPCFFPEWIPVIRQMIIDASL